uniref:Uncharacterized protein n=1 Tax=Romanomermis culicivorax TaxID=13658 RepID=A0A915HUL9_ROMCU
MLTLSAAFLKYSKAVELSATVAGVPSKYIFPSCSCTTPLSGSETKLRKNNCLFNKTIPHLTIFFAKNTDLAKKQWVVQRAGKILRFQPAPKMPKDQGSLVIDQSI